MMGAHGDVGGGGGSMLEHHELNIVSVHPAQVGDIKDVKSAKAAAKSTGEVALAEGGEHFDRLIKDHFGGAATLIEAVKTCMYTLPELRKAITQYRNSTSPSRRCPRSRVVWPAATCATDEEPYE